MKFHAATIRSLIPADGDKALVLGIAGGRVACLPEARWLYSVRFLLLIVRIEVLWMTGEAPDADLARAR